MSMPEERPRSKDDDDTVTEASHADWLRNFRAFFDNDPAEVRVAFAVLDSFLSYRRTSHYNVTHQRRQSFYALPQSQWTLLAKAPFNYLDTLTDVDKAIDANADIAEAIALFTIAKLGGQEISAPNRDEADASMSHLRGPDSHHGLWTGTATARDHEKAHSTIRQLYRDWSAEGAAERAACYGPVLQQLNAEFHHLSPGDKSRAKILVPGSGLGRLQIEIVRAGYHCVGNEISHHQSFASLYLLNALGPRDRFPLYPFALRFSNHLNRASQLRMVMVPDVHPETYLREAAVPGTLHHSERCELAAADFCVCYNKAENADGFAAVATVFFIDTAPNLIAYVEAVRNCLVRGGIWINHGPLTWHFENNPPGKQNEDDQARSLHNGVSGSGSFGIGEPGSFELCNDEVLTLVAHNGFTIEKCEWGESRMGYIQDADSMLVNDYKPAFWVARKK